MPALKIAVQLRCLRQPIRQALIVAGRIGAQGVEIDCRNDLRPSELSETALRQFRKLLDDLNLRVVALSFRTRRGYDVADELDRRVDATKAALQMAHSLGAQYVLNVVGHLSEDEEDPRHQLLLDVLNDLANYGNRVGAMLAAETGHDSPADLARLLGKLPTGAIAVALDPAALVLGGYEPLSAVEMLGNDIQYVAARDAIGDRTASRGMEVALGRGTVDFPALLGALEQRDYRGYFTVARDHSTDPAAQLEQAIQFLRSL